jgi:hypothetical protein
MLIAPFATSVAHGETVPDASLRAVGDRVVRLEVVDAPAVEGRLLGFEADTLTIARSGSNEVVSVPRAKLLRVIAIDPSAVRRATVTAGPERLRVAGVQFGLPGTLVVDADYRLFRGFASANVLFPVLTASGDSLWTAGSAGVGIAVPISESRRWKLDVFGQVLPLHVTSHYTYLAFGIGAGFHYTAPSGFTFGVSFPIAGFATRFGSSPYGYDAAFTYNDSLGYYYLAGAAGMPLVTMGYRFATNCPR